jgi:hypothetical protein
MSKKKRKKNKSKALRPGVGLELAAARIQQLMDPGSRVTHNEILEDRTGNKRQYDVVIRATFGGQAMLGIIECRDHKEKIGPDGIEAFAKNMENLGANLRMILSRKGFTKQALRLAAHEHITCLSLLPHDPTQTGLSIGHFWYGTARFWTDARLAIHFAGKAPPTIDVPFDSIAYGGLPVANWFLREFITVHSQDKEPGEYCLRLPFANPIDVEIGGTKHTVIAFACYATWVQSNKRTWACWYGDAFYDWHRESINIPAHTDLIGGGVPSDIMLWEDYEGPIPPPEVQRSPRAANFILNTYQRWHDNFPAPDLAPSATIPLTRRLSPDVGVVPY